MRRFRQSALCLSPYSLQGAIRDHFLLEVGHSFQIPAPLCYEIPGSHASVLEPSGQSHSQSDTVLF